jgi:8-oxo-dGTP pyrophosphatase MutT (NUDIX family)
MKRQPLIHLLERYIPSDAEEIAAKAQMLGFIHAHERCFERSLAEGHITASAWLLSSDGSRALLMHHAKLGRWFQLGGHSDGNPNTLEVAIQEAKEESGLTAISAVTSSIFDIDIHWIPQNPKEKAHFHYDVRFLLRAEGEEELKQNHESKQLLWVTKERSCLPTDERSVVRMFEKWIASSTF